MVYTLGMVELDKRITGCFLGLALGDAVGAPFEGSATGPKNLTELPEVLYYTDDTEMSIGVAESLILCSGFDPFRMAETFVRNFNINRGYGPGTIRVLELISQGMPWHEANTAVFERGSFGNGAAMRSAPLGIFFRDDIKKVIDVVPRASSITHSHPLGIEGALLIAGGVCYLLAGKNREELLPLLRGLSGIAEYREKLDHVEKLLKEEPEVQEVAAALGNSIAALDSVPTAIYAFLRFGENYEKTIEYIMELGGDTDTIGSMAGALAGAYLGIDALPQDWLGRLENGEKGSDYIYSLAHSFYADEQL